MKNTMKKLLVIILAMAILLSNGVTSLATSGNPPVPDITDSITMPQATINIFGDPSQFIYIPDDTFIPIRTIEINTPLQVTIEVEEPSGQSTYVTFHMEPLFWGLPNQISISSGIITYSYLIDPNGDPDNPSNTSDGQIPYFENDNINITLGKFPLTLTNTTGAAIIEVNNETYDDPFMVPQGEIATIEFTLAEKFKLDPLQSQGWVPSGSAFALTTDPVVEPEVRLPIIPFTDEEVYEYNLPNQGLDLDLQGFLNVKHFDTKEPHNWNDNPVDGNYRYSIFGQEVYEEPYVLQTPLTQVDGEYAVLMQPINQGFSPSDFGLYDEVATTTSAVATSDPLIKNGVATTTFGAVNTEGAGRGSLYWQINNGNSTDIEFYNATSVWGYFVPEKSGFYQLGVYSDDGAYGTITHNGSDVEFVNNWKYQPSKESSTGQVLELEAGIAYPIYIDWFDNQTVGASFVLLMKYGATTESLDSTFKAVPAPYLFPSEVDNGWKPEDIAFDAASPITGIATITNGTAEPLTQLEIEFKDADNDTITFGAIDVDASGNWSISPKDIDTLTDGDISITAKYINVTGQPEIKNIIKLPPATPTITAQKDNVNKDKDVTVTAILEPGETLYVDKGNGTYEAVGQNPYIFDVSISGTRVRAYVQDAAGNQSQVATKLIVVDFEAPEPPVITSPEEGDVGTYETMTVVGTAEPLSFVNVEVSDGVNPPATGQVQTDANGNFTVVGIDTSALALGGLMITATATDSEDNTSPPSNAVNVIKTKAFVGSIEYRIPEAPENPILDGSADFGTIQFIDTYEEKPVVLADTFTENTIYRVAANLRLDVTGLNAFEAMLEMHDKRTGDYQELIGYAAVREGSIVDVTNTIIGEAGKTTLDFNDDPGEPNVNTPEWKTVELVHEYDNPVVIVQMNSYNGTDTTHVRLRNVTSNTFDIYLEEWTAFEDSDHHVEEDIGYIVLEAGELGEAIYTMNDGTIIEVYSVDDITTEDDLATNSGVKVRAFDTYFDNLPVVLSQIQTYNGAHQIVTRQSDLTVTSVAIVLLEDKDKHHKIETTGYVAIGKEDVTAPTPTIEVTPAGLSVSRDVKIIPEEPGNLVEYSFDNVNWVPYTGVFSVDYNITVYARETDGAGNTTNPPASASVVVQRALTINVSGNGTTSRTPTAVMYDTGTQVTVTGAAAVGSYVSEMSLNGVPVLINPDALPKSITHTMALDSNVVSVTFAAYEAIGLELDKMVDIGNGIVEATFTYTNPNSGTALLPTMGAQVDNINAVITNQGSIAYNNNEDDIIVTFPIDEAVTLTVSGLGLSASASAAWEESDVEHYARIEALLELDGAIVLNLGTNDRELGTTDSDYDIPRFFIYDGRIFRINSMTSQPDLSISFTGNDRTFAYSYTVSDAGIITYHASTVITPQPFVDKVLAKDDGTFDVIFTYNNPNDYVIPSVLDIIHLNDPPSNLPADIPFPLWGVYDSNNNEYLDLPESLLPGEHVFGTYNFTASAITATIICNEINTATATNNPQDALYTIAVAANGPGSVSVTPPEEGEYYRYGEVVTVTESHGSNVHFTGWTGYEATGSSFSFEVTGNEYIIGNFRSYTPTTYYQVNIDSTEGGSVNGTGIYKKGDTITLVPVADEGYEFVEFAGDIDTLEGNVLTVTGTMTLTAIFEKIDDEIIDIDPETIPGGSPDEEDIIDGELPEGSGELPETGSIPLEAVALVGTTVMGIGLKLKKRK